ncbi:hypothetical protein DU52_01545 [Methanosarcina mazei]|uniref:Glycosyl transferase family 1 domain-containing protein n=1 Tax=Methanosarcina mazei TaxID=2209 RepID=A0A0F8DND0_METMZ|nr:glycosyltransferase [Methanosarcina mazei]KKG29101.1 hypothetical protein DU52_01545 [Methanosarcina mazei]
MKLLVTGKLANRSLLHHIYPITLLDDVDEILVVRDTEGSAANKVKYYCPPRWSLKFLPLAFAFKFIIMVYLSISKKPKIVFGYLLFPHASMAFIVGKLTGKKVGISLIAGPVELYASGSPIGNYPYCNPLPKLNIRARIFRWMLANSDFITVTGKYTKGFLTSIGINENTILVLPHSIDNQFGIKNIDKEYDIIFVGRLAKVKHVEILLKAVQSVKSSYPSIKVTIVGDGDCKPELENLSNKLGLNKNVHFAGYQKNVWDWYNKSKISVLPSEREGFPYSVVESLSCGVPVVTSDCGDVNDLIKDGYNGLIVKKYDDFDEFALSIIRILDNNRILETYSANCLESVKNINVNTVTYIWRNSILNLLSK